MAVQFQGKSGEGTVPFPRNVNEWMAKGMTQEAAEHKMRQDVFGHDYKTDAKGNPIETGKGSASQQTAQHLQAKAISDDAEIARRMRTGWHPGLEHAFDPRTAAPRRRAAARRKKQSSKTAPAAAETTV